MALSNAPPAVSNPFSATSPTVFTASDATGAADCNPVCKVSPTCSKAV